jgi:hypothetical protein
MTGVPGTVGRSDWRLPRAPGRLKSERKPRLESVTVPPLVLRALPFLALAIFASAHWTALVEPAQTRRAVVSSLAATTGGVLIALSGRLPRASALALRLVLVVATAVLAIAAIGIRFKLLMPGGWGTLTDRISGGLSVVGSVSEWPYNGPNVWLRLTTLLAAPLALTLASVAAFWPRSERSRSRPLALILLVALYGVAVASRPFGHQALRGLGLLVCLAAWLWLPRLKGRDALAAATTVGLAALLALLLTPKLASSEPWIDYRHWSWSLHREKAITFDWRHSYGPLHWPRKGTTLLLIRSKHPHYWKAETLDHFDGVRWTNSALADPDVSIANTAINPNPRWMETVHVTVRGLRSPVVIGPGSLQSVSGLSSDPITLANETALTNGELSQGDTYTARGYTPDPSARQMRGAPPPDQFLAKYTTIDLPSAGGFVATHLQVPLRGEPQTGDPAAARALEGSRYAPMYSLARKVAGGATSNYDIVKRIGAWLEGHYGYSERPPRRAYPLEAFLFRDKKGYCQQFSGSAALMLRMLGIPVRVASGFAPGTLNTDTHEYVVRDLDAHSWIEVWFEGIGWVPFDPTPALAPASSQAGSFAPISENASAARGDTKDRLPAKLRAEILGVSPKGGAGIGAPQGGTPWGWVIVGVVTGMLALLALVISVLRLRMRARPLPAPCGDPEVDHLVRLLARLGLEIGTGTTLLELEKRLRRLGGDDVAVYARRLRERRFGVVDGQPPPRRADRRRLRQLLAKAAGAGPLARVHLAMPDNLAAGAALRKRSARTRRVASATRR